MNTYVVITLLILSNVCKGSQTEPNELEIACKKLKEIPKLVHFIKENYKEDNPFFKAIVSHTIRSTSPLNICAITLLGQMLQFSTSTHPLNNELNIRTAINNKLYAISFLNNSCSQAYKNEKYIRQIPSLNEYQKEYFILIVTELNNFVTYINREN